MQRLDLRADCFGTITTGAVLAHQVAHICVSGVLMLAAADAQYPDTLIFWGFQKVDTLTFSISFF